MISSTVNISSSLYHLEEWNKRHVDVSGFVWGREEVYLCSSDSTVSEVIKLMRICIINTSTLQMSKVVSKVVDSQEDRQTI